MRCQYTRDVIIGTYLHHSNSRHAAYIATAAAAIALVWWAEWNESAIYMSIPRREKSDYAALTRLADAGYIRSKHLG